MDKPISVGDLVQVVRGHECAIGEVFYVGGLRRPRSGRVTCIQCRGKWWVPMTELLAEVRGEEYAIEVSRLKRIPPLSELEGVRTEETLKEPA